MNVEEDEGEIAPVARKPSAILFPAKNTVETLKKARRTSIALSLANYVDIFVKISPKNLQQNAKIVDFMTRKKEFFTNPTDAKPLKWVIKVVQVDTPMDEIKGQLLDMSFPVSRISRFSSRKDRTPLPIFQIQLHDCQKAKEILGPKTLLYTVT